jgi:hypothetical protein
MNAPNEESLTQVGYLAAKERAAKVRTIDREDCHNALARHMPDGELYVVRSCSVWEGENIVGSRIIVSAGPISTRDLGLERGDALDPSPELFNLIDDWANLETDDADWLQAEEGAGRLLYPIGVR